MLVELHDMDFLRIIKIVAYQSTISNLFCPLEGHGNQLEIEAEQCRRLDGPSFNPFNAKDVYSQLR